MKLSLRRIQQKLGVEADGILGPRTLAAMNKVLGIEEPPRWPTQAEVRRGITCFGSPGNESMLTSLVPAYPLLYEGKPVRSIRVHEVIARHVQDAFREVLAHYGQDEIHRLGLDVYGGSYAYRNTSNGRALSMHAWGIALDFAPQGNAYSTRAPRATLSHPDCDAWWDIWESHGAVSLGRECGHDWMHLQFARLT